MASLAEYSGAVMPSIISLFNNENTGSFLLMFLANDTEGRISKMFFFVAVNAVIGVHPVHFATIIFGPCAHGG